LKNHFDLIQSNDTAIIPQNDPNPKARATAIATKRAGFLYGPSLIGDASPYPDGPLGKQRVQQDMDLWGLDRAIIDKAVGADAQACGAAIAAVSLLCDHNFDF